MTLPKAIICDLDGTLCDHSQRLHFIDWSVPKPGYHQKPCETCKNGSSHLEDPWFHNETGKDWKPDWDAFYAGISDDRVNEWCQSILSSMEIGQWEPTLIFVTGRPEKYRKETEDWLKKQQYTWMDSWNKLFMRPNFINYCPELPQKMHCGPITRDFRPAHEVKREIYEREIAGKYGVLFVLEDDERCAEMYKNLGLTVLRVMK